MGDTVYWIHETETNLFDIDEGQVQSFCIDETGLWIFCRYKSGLTYWHKIDKFINEVRTDRTKAEAKLKEVGGNV